VGINEKSPHKNVYRLSSVT